jgi:uncharacterized membrane protein YbhN (UPF0104 family)
MGISSYFLYLFIANIGESGQIFQTARANVISICAAVMINLSAHYLRAIRSAHLLKPIKPSTYRQMFMGLSVGFLCNNILPFRLGELVRADWIGRDLKISRVAVLCTILFERLIDGAILLICFGTLTLLVRKEVYDKTYLEIALALSLALILTGTTLYLFLNQSKWFLKSLFHATGWFNDRIRDRSRLILWSAIYSTNLFLRKSGMLSYLLLSLGAWFLYLSSIALFFYAVAPNAGWVDSFLASVASFLCVSIPSGPAYIGTYHFALSKMLMSIPEFNSTSSSATILSWFIHVLPISIVGALVLILRSKPSQTRSRTELEAKQNRLDRTTDISSEFSRFLDTYFACTEISRVISDQEILGQSKLLRTFRGGSNAVTMLVWAGGREVVRKMTLRQHAGKLQAQYRWLVERKQTPHIARVLSESTDSHSYSVDLEYKPDYSRFFDFIHSHPTSMSLKIIDDLIHFAETNIYLNESHVDSSNDLDVYVKQKLLEKISDSARMNATLRDLMGQETVQVNGETFDNIARIVEKIQKNEKILGELAKYRRTSIHGDLTIDNILVRDNDFILLDPNDENQISDKTVDYAKLYQSLHSGYEFLCLLNTVAVEGNSILFEENLSSQYRTLFLHLDAKLRSSLSRSEYRSVLFHEAVHFARMLTYRVRISPATAPAFYGVCVRLLNQYVAQFEEHSSTAPSGHQRAS